MWDNLDIEMIYIYNCINKYFQKLCYNCVSLLYVNWLLNILKLWITFSFIFSYGEHDFHPRCKPRNISNNYGSISRYFQYFSFYIIQICYIQHAISASLDILMVDIYIWYTKITPTFFVITLFIYFSWVICVILL